jgi:cytochrome c peroxidase
VRLAALLILAAAGAFALETEPSDLKARAKLAVEEFVSYEVFVRRSEATSPQIELGRALFFDPRLSRDKTVSCATCHVPEKDWTDGLPRAVVGKRVLKRNTPSLLTAGYYRRMGWDGRTDSPAEASLFAVENPEEMNLKIPQLVARLRKVPGYAPLFEAAYGKAGISRETIGQALAAFSLAQQAAEDSPFDRYLKDGTGLSASAERGLVIYNSKGGCRNCHFSRTLTDNRFRRIGVRPADPRDIGRFQFDARKDNWEAFRTPTLRNAARTAPYMHDGSLKSLAEVVEFYDRGGDELSGIDSDMQGPLGLTDGEKKDLVAFLESMTSSSKAPEARPVLPPDR